LWAGSLLVLGCEAPRPRSLILISVDTLRADHLGCYGHERPTSPSLDALAAEGVLFEDVTAPSPWTLPSHASLFTGRYPSRHGVRTVHEALSRSAPTLAEVLSPLGFENGAVVNVVYLYPVFGLMRGFAQLERVESVPSPQGDAAEVHARARSWLASRRGRRVFLFLHHYDVHAPYSSEPAYERMFAAAEGQLRGVDEELGLINRGLLRPGPVGIDQLERRYDAGIRQIDDELGRFLAWLEEEGWLEDTLLVVTSDHGEGFLEHGTVSHGRTQYEEELRVPLILRGPGLPRGVRVREPVSLVDVAPTLLWLLGVPPPPDLDGRDLRPFWQGAPAATERAIFAEAAPALWGTTRLAVRMDSHKLLLDEASGQRELYDLAKDPGERRDLAAQDPERVRRLEAALHELRRSEAPSTRLQLPPELLERLRALGYY
jgi:arylsulfatase A-like enzyme